MPIKKEHIVNEICISCNETDCNNCLIKAEVPDRLIAIFDKHFKKSVRAKEGEIAGIVENHDTYGNLNYKEIMVNQIIKTITGDEG